MEGIFIAQVENGFIWGELVFELDADDELNVATSARTGSYEEGDLFRQLQDYYRKKKEA